MVEANVAIIKELKQYLEEISMNAEKRNEYTRSEKDFTRDRVLTFSRLAGFLLHLPKRSLSIELREYLDRLSSGTTVSKSAFSQQRVKLKPTFFQQWNQLLTERFYHHYGEKVKRWRGHLLQAVDGSCCYLFNKDEVLNHFGSQDNQHVRIPMARLMQVYDVLNELVVWADIYPVKKSEQSIMYSRVNSLSEKSITLFDRGYPSFALIYLLQHENKERLFVMRCRSDFNKEIKQFLQSAATDIITEFTATEKAIKTLHDQGYDITKSDRVKIRLVKIILSSGQTEVLITNLLDQKHYSLEDLSYLYSLRWPVETSYGHQKNIQQLEQFSGHRVICIEQDYHAGVFTANLQSLIEKQSSEYLNAIARQRKYQYKINRNVSLAGLKNNVSQLFLQVEPKEILIYLQHLFESCLEPVRPGRKVKRYKKARRLNGKYQTLTNYKRAI